MSTNDGLETVRALAARVTDARRALADTIEQRDAAICEAIDARGVAPARVGAAAGLSKSSLSRILWAADVTDTL